MGDSMDFEFSSTDLLCPGIALAAIVFGFYYWKTHSRTMKAWQDFAKQHGWEYSTANSTFKIQGLHQGSPFSLYTEWRFSNGHEHLYTLMKLSLANAIPASLCISREALGDKLGKLFGKRDDEIGDAEMDEALDLKNLSDEARDILLAPRVRECLLLLRRRSPYFLIENEELTVWRSGMPKSLEALEFLVVPALELSEALHAAATKARKHRSG
jgi:hypothetical protein